MHFGVKAYNCSVNQSKTQANFNVETGSSGGAVGDAGSGSNKTSNNNSRSSNDNATALWHASDTVTYCGLCIDCVSVEIRADYSRYAGVDIRSTVTVPPVVSGEDLRRLTRSFLKPRSHALLFDTSVNSVKTAAFNVFEIGVLAAMKFHVHVCTMPQQPLHNSVFFFETIVDAARYMWWLVSDRARSRMARGMGDEEDQGGEDDAGAENAALDRRGCELQCECALTQMQVHWLVLSSFVVVLSRKQARYRGVLAQLRAFCGKRRFASLPGQVRAGVAVQSVLLNEVTF
jgi:hypothetical protein